jgi:hypothetical protein
MGIFGSKKKRYVDTAIVRVVEDEHLPDVIHASMNESIFNDRDFVPTLQQGMLNGKFRNFERMYRFAERGDYYYGLPNSKVLTSSDGFPAAQAQLESEIGYPVTFDYIHFRPLNNIHMGWKHLIEQLNYDHDTNIIADLEQSEGWPAYLEKMVAVHTTESGLEPEPSSIGNWWTSTQAGETPLRPAQASALGLQAQIATEEVRIGEAEIESVEIHYAWYNETTGTHQQALTVLDLTSYDTDQEFYQARYRYTTPDTVEHIGYWLYDPANGTNTELNNTYAMQDYVAPGTYFPFVIFRSEDINRTAPQFHSTEQYTSTKALLKVVGMDFQELGDAIHENPDIGDIRQAVLMMGVRITTTNEVEIEYLYRYFKALEARLPPPNAAVNSPTVWGNFLNATPQQSYAIEISDADYRMKISVDEIRIKLRAGSIGVVGTLENSLTAIYNTPESPTPNLGLGFRKSRFIRKQITESVYEEIEVVNPQMRYEIFRDKGVSGGVDDDRFIIPLDYNITKDMQAIDVEKLYYRSLHFVFNSLITQKVKWYQTGLFKAVLIIIAIVITFYTWGETWELIVAAVELGTAAAYLAATYAIAVEIVTQVAIQWTLSEIAQAIGADWALVIAAVAYTAATRDFKGGTNWLSQALAENMLTIANGLVTGARDTIAKAFSEYSSEVQEFNLMADAKWEELEDVEKLLDSGIDLDPFLFVGKEPLVIAGETPEVYYSRTVHSGNIGVESLNFIQNYVGISLRLPKVDETTKEHLYV